MATMNFAKDLVSQLKSKKSDDKWSQLSMLYYSMIKVSGSWIPYDEFMELPLDVIFDILGIEEEVKREESKQYQKIKNMR